MNSKMTCFGLLLLLMVQFSPYQTDALRHGSAPRWILDMFCKGTQNILLIPWNCGGYLHCTSSSTAVSGVWIACARGLKFDERFQACVRYPAPCLDAKSVAFKMCPRYKDLKFPHPASCALYYDCSQKNVLSQFNLGMYENECPYPQLFDQETGKCRQEQQSPITCVNKPASRSDYRKEAMSTSPECVGLTDGAYSKPGVPIFSPDYIVCTSGSNTLSKRCQMGQVFDPVQRQCSSDCTESIKTYCRMYPLAIFPDSQHCARYYNCSSTLDYFHPNPHKNECPYMFLYDIAKSSCVKHDKLTVPCGTRFEPINPCDYKVGQCIGRRFCIPCAAKCKGKPDGPHPYSPLVNKRFHIICEGERTLQILTCITGQIYSDKHKHCIYEDETNKQPATTSPATTSPASTSPATTALTTTPSTSSSNSPPVCTCLDEIDLLMTNLQNISSFVDVMYFDMKVSNPYDCDEPPSIPNSIMTISYEFDMVVSRYTCVDGYSTCGDELNSTCSKNNIWDRSSLGECLQNTWTDRNNVNLTCELLINSALLFRGRSVEDMYTFSLTDKDEGTVFLYVKVTPKIGRIEAGRSFGQLTTVASPVPLTGETTWTVELNAVSFEISVNGHHCISVVNPSSLSLITSFLLSDGFHALEVKYLFEGIQTSSGKHKLNVNLALNKPTTSSSTYEQAVSERAVDGYSHVLWGEHSCWTASATDTTPWWMVDLGKEFYVSHVVITSLHCEGSCGKSLRNFRIDVFKEFPIVNTTNAEKEQCDIYGGTFQPSNIERIDCGSDVSGQYVMVAANGALTDQMTLCEVEVYGGLETSKDWSPFTCPDPPVVAGASVRLSYTYLEAMATYKCDGSDVMCIGNKVIHCHNETGWDATPGMCVKRIRDAGIGGSLPDFPICRLNLGSGIELWATPSENTGYLDLIHGDDTILRMALSLNDSAKPIALNHIVSGMKSSIIYPPQNPFIKGQESHIIISILTDYILIEVDGKILQKYPVNRLNVHVAIFVESSEYFRIRKAKIYPDFIFKVLREPQEDNLALAAGVESSSSYANPESYGVDGNPSQPWPTGSCWNADIGDTDQWYQVDLGRQYFIREIVIDLRSLSDQANQNLALRKETFGTPNFDSHSSHDNVVDGNHDDRRLSNSCYTSSASENDPWWMVDLGRKYTISSVAVQHHGDEGNIDHYSDLSVIIYESNPTIIANAQPTTCTEKTGPWGPFDRIPCSRPTNGQFVMVKRLQGVKNRSITICEVQVFGDLESRLHNFTVNLYEENPEIGRDTVSRRCIKHHGEFPKEKATNLTCAEDVWGRYVRIKADDIRDKFDQMTLCEIEVYGDKAVKREWSPYDCPDPPMHQNAFVSVAYTPIKAVANYQCFDGFATCNGRNTITCTSEGGWIETPESCLPRTFSAYDPNGLEIVHFCPLRLGEAIELYIIPTAVNFHLALSAKSDIFVIKWRTDPRREIVITTDLTGVEPYPPVIVEPVPFKIDKESKVVITVLSEALHVDIDGQTFYIKVKSPYLINTVWTKKATMGKLSILKAGVSETKLISSLENLAASGPASASSSYGATHAGWAVDGDMRMGSDSCWSTSNGDMDAWWLVELDKLYFVSHVKITTMGQCGTDCNRRVHDFRIETLHRKPEPKDTGELCLKFDGVLLHASTTTLTCTEKVFGRVLRISAPDRRNELDLFTLCEVQVFGGLVAKKGDGPRNLALFRPALTSSEFDFVALAGRAVDGNKDIKYISGSCWLAAIGDSDPWWQVELDNYYFISHVEITSRIDCGPTCKNAVRDFVIEVSSRNPTHGLQIQLCLKYDGVFPHSTTRSLKCINKALGRFVKISTYGRTSHEDLFTLCEVEVYGEEVSFDEATSANLAANRPVSSSSRLSPPQLAADGNKNMDWSGGSCWSAEDGDTTSWWMVELDDYYLVSEVEITSRNDCGTECNKRLRNFKIELFNEKPQPGENGDVCLVHPDVFPHSKTKILQCREKTLGRFVRLTAYDRLADDGLTICEFGVFGSKVSRSGWTPSSCPEPPLLPNACVDVSYNKEHAVATYTCNSNYSMCTGSNVLYCIGKEGWEGTPGNCVQTTLEVHSPNVTDLNKFPMCYPKLGEGLEMWVTPEESGCKLELLTDYRDSTALRITIVPENITDPVTVTKVVTGSDINVPIGRKSLFTLHKESHVIVVFLTSGLLVTVDGNLLVLTSHTPSSAKIGYISSSDGLRIRMFRPVGRYLDGIVRVTVSSRSNLAWGSNVAAASSLSTSPPSNLVDRDVSQNAENGKCWLPASGEKDQWVMIDLGEYYFIRELIIYNHKDNSCLICEKRTRDFVINAYSTESGDDVMTCAVYEGVMALGAVETIRCKEDVWGRYVRISTAKQITGEQDLMTFCGIEIYGDEVIKRPWTIFDCPDPPHLSDASVQLSYSPHIAVATYTCNTDSTMCTGSNVLQCTSESGWEGTLGTCLRTTLERNYGRANDLNKFTICNPKLGEAIELWIIPNASGSMISLMLSETGDTALSVIIRPDQASQRVHLVTNINGTSGNEVLVTKDLFTLEMEAHVVVVFLTHKLLILVDGVMLAVFSHHLPTPEISFIKSTLDVNIRQFRPVPRYLDGIVRFPVRDNLAHYTATTSSSLNATFSHTYFTDGIIMQSDGEKCPHPNVGDKDQWVMIDLGDYYFIRELILYNRGSSDCADACAERTHDFAIDILPNDKIDELTTRCAFYGGIMPAGAVEKIRCEEDAWGRYVRISATNVKNSQDLMTFCEVQVYGDAVVDTQYIKCPSPVQVDNGQITYTGLEVKDVATLTCKANYKPCSGKLTAVCQESAEWEKMTTCDRNRWESPTVPFLEKTPCGSLTSLAVISYTFKVTPISNTRFIIDLKKGDDILLRMDNFINYDGNTNKTVLKSQLSGIWGVAEEAKSQFSPGQEATIEIRYVSVARRYELLVDGTELYHYNESMAGVLPDMMQVVQDVKLSLVEVLWMELP